MLNKFWNWVLFMALERGNVFWKDVAIKCGADIKTKETFFNKGVSNSLQRAVARDDIQAVAFLLENGVSVHVDTCDWDWDTPLVLAARRGNIPIAKLLLDAGADVNKEDGTQTAIRRASGVSYDNSKMVNFLISKGATIESEEDEWYSPIIDAIEAHNFTMIECLCKNGFKVDIGGGSGWSPLAGVINAVGRYDANTKTFKFLVEKMKANIHWVESDGRNLLHFAIYNHEWAIVRFLVKKGIDINEEYEGKTPLERLVNHKCQDLAILLVKKGAKVKKCNDENGLFQLALLAGMNRLAGLLQQKGFGQIIVPK